MIAVHHNLAIGYICDSKELSFTGCFSLPLKLHPNFHVFGKFIRRLKMNQTFVIITKCITWLELHLNIIADFLTLNSLLDQFKNTAKTTVQILDWLRGLFYLVTLKIK